MGYIVLLTVAVIAISDLSAFLARLASRLHIPLGSWVFPWPLRPNLRQLPIYNESHEYTGLVGEPEGFDDADREGLAVHHDDMAESRHARFNDVDTLYEYQELDGEKHHMNDMPSGPWRPQYHSDRPSSSASPATTLDSLDSYHPSSKPNEEDHDQLPARQSSKTTWSSVGRMVVYLTEWIVVVVAFALSLSGGAVYTGTCRSTYNNGCLAHLISTLSTLQPSLVALIQ